MSKYVFKGEIKGDGHHFGNNYFESSKEFIKSSSHKYSSSEKDLIELIFDNFQTEDEKRNLLNSLKNLSENPEENLSEIPVWKKFINQLTDFGLKEVAERVIDIVKHRIPDLSI